MRSHSPSFLFLLGLVGLMAVAVTYPMWRSIPEDETTVTVKPTPTPRRSAFQYAPPPNRERPAFDDEQAYTEEQVRRQLMRRSMMERQQVRQNIVENSSMPEAVRSRFREEMDRLDALAAAHPQIQEEVAVDNVPRQVKEDGSFTPEFQEVVQVMKQTGEWDRMHEDFLQDVEKQANDPNLPPEERPSREEVERIRSGALVPVL